MAAPTFLVEFSKAWRGVPTTPNEPLPYVRPSFATIYKKDSADEAIRQAKAFLNERLGEELEGWVDTPLRDEERTGGGEWAGDMRRWRVQEWTDADEGGRTGSMKEWSAEEWWDKRGCWVRRIIFGDGRMEIAVRVRGVIEEGEQGRGEQGPAQGA
ncbi:MAG: hypothetical protein Q9195_004664 [Heterodermia aff. obscurata]